MRIDGQNNKKNKSNAYLCEKRKSTCVSILLIFVINIGITLSVIYSTEEKYIGLLETKNGYIICTHKGA